MIGVPYENLLSFFLSFLKRMVQANIKRQNYQTFVKNIILMSAKSVLSDIIPVVNQKGGRLYYIFATKVAFSGLYVVLRIVLLISYLS